MGSIRLVYGNTGSGKSQFIFDEIKNKLHENNKQYIITPEQFSYQMERKLLEVIGKESVVNVEVVSFNRIAERILIEVGGASTTHLSKAGQAMLIYNIIEKQKDKLKFLKDSNNSVDLVLNTIQEFKKHNITHEKINQTQENINDVYLKEKLKDINNLYTAYATTISNNYIDENDLLAILIKQLDESKMFDNSYVYIDEFYGFTGQEYEIIKKILKKSQQLTITLCTDSLEINKDKEVDIFYSNKITAQKLLNIAYSENINIENEIKLEHIYKFKNDELRFLEKNLSSIFYKKYNEDVKNINICLAENPYEQMKQIAKTIVQLTRTNGYRYKDIAIITTDVDSISSIAKTIFAKYEIPVFIDTKEDLARQYINKIYLIFIRYICK